MSGLLVWRLTWATPEVRWFHNGIVVLTRINSQSTPRIFARGGTVYLPFSPLLASNQRLQQFDQAIWSRLTAAKSKYDPAGVLTPGAGLFQA
jgi:hypothetical protein